MAIQMTAIGSEDPARAGYDADKVASYYEAEVDIAVKMVLSA
jgi:hypothetical protein